MLLRRSQIAAMIPHAGSMCLLDGVVSADNGTITCIAENPLADSNPLRENGRLGSWTLIEYGAQAAAIHKGIEGGQSTLPGAQGRAAYIAQLKEIHASSPWVPTGPLTVQARCLVSDGNAAAYQIDVSCEGKPLLSGRITLAMG